MTNADILDQGNLNLVSEKSGKSQGILLSIICGNPQLAGNREIFIPVSSQTTSIDDTFGIFNFVFHYILVIKYNFYYIV